jgi:hypothetical protein
MASPLNVRPKVPCECEHSRLRVRGASAKMLLKSPLRTTCSSLSQSSPRIEPLHCGPSNAYPNRKRRQLMAQGRIPSATQRFFLLSEELLPCLRAAGMPHHDPQRTSAAHAHCDAAFNAMSIAASRVHYSITWSARDISAGGMVTPIAFAVFRLKANSNSVGCSIGRSAGFAPLRILST